MAVSDGDAITVMKDMGLVTTVFDERKLSGLRGHMAIGHTRYSTAGSSDWMHAQPVFRGVGRAGFALGHNGNLTNTEALGELANMLPGLVSSDSDLVAELLGQAFPPEDPEPDTGRGGGRPRAGADDGAPVGGGGVLVRAPRRRPAHRCPRPERVPAAVPRAARGHRGVRDGLGAGLGVPRPRRDRRHLHPRARARRDGGHRRQRGALRVAVPLRAPQPEALHLRVRLLRQTRHQALRERGARRPSADGPAAGLPGAGPGRSGHGRARLRGAGGRRVRGGLGHPLRSRAR